MFSATSVERPEAGLPQEPHSQLPQLRAGVKDHARCQWEEIPPDGNPPWRAVKERNQVRELYSAQPERGTRPGQHSLYNSLEQSDRGKGVQTKPRPRLYHSIQPQWSWMSQREPEGTVQCLTSRKQINLCLVKNSQNLIHHIGLKAPFPGPRPLPRQDVCSYIEMPRNIDCSQQEELFLGPPKDLVRQLV